ncbi:complex I intermediate-associated protein 30, mitochondrial-like [Patiria miniata]|uniref:NADH:ubiquinone oxidoreductase intermediate-associated protein 30 domain-containing protein n=1 Tax=Patiria miniata TaxID=46514 RepID=A0A914ATI2_PATMI|nr:complex I intermediate-associated protein 30, mitochondrial-like [Patiria miniata]
MSSCKSRLLLRCSVRYGLLPFISSRPPLACQRTGVSLLLCRHQQSDSSSNSSSSTDTSKKEPYSKFLTRNLKMWGGEIYDRLVCSNLDTMFDTTRSMWRFAGTDSFKDFQVLTDQDIGGQSWAKLEPSRNNKLLFHGNLCTTVPRDGETARSGYCSLKSKQQFVSFNRKKHMDLTPFNSLNLRLRGDGRAYMVNIMTEGYFTDYHDDIWSYFLFTRGGPYWQDVSIPFSKFFLSSRGRIQDRQAAVDLELVNAIGLTMADAIDGEFALEIDSIAASYDATHTEEFAYEMYHK